MFPLVLLLMSTGAFAQTNADEATVRTLLNQSTKDTYALKKTEYDAGFANLSNALIAYNTRSVYMIAAGDRKPTDVFFYPLIKTPTPCVRP